MGTHCRGGAVSIGPEERRGREHDRHMALLRAYELRWQMEDGVAGASEAIDAALAEAEENDWPDVRLAALYAVVSRSTLARDGSLDEAISRLLEQAQADGNAAMVALALANRVTRWLDRPEAASSMPAADADLARATALLEQDDGSPIELVTAHNRCAIAYGQRQLFELELHHYQAAERYLDRCEDQRRVAGILFNKAEANLSWAAALRHVGASEEVAERVAAGMAALRACEAAEMPDTWRWELGVVELVLRAVGGEDVAARAEELLAEVATSPSYAGRLQMALALSEAGRDKPRARVAAEKALELLDAIDSPPEHDLALLLAAELEEATIGGCSAGLRYGRAQAALRWGARLSSLAAMEELVSSERLRAETEYLRRQAFLDELTGLANRRGYARYVAGLATRGPKQVALLLVDVDRFKQVNDQFGHAAGDAALFRIGRILARAIRSEDLAARLGGDEFAVVLAGAGASVGAKRARAIIDALEREPWHEIRAGLTVRASVGVAADDPSQYEAISARADSELYRAKAAGGARACVG
jgi:diguanylate cyclase (GGDEF)-like protein